MHSYRLLFLIHKIALITVQLFCNDHIAVQSLTLVIFRYYLCCIPQWSVTFAGRVPLDANESSKPTEKRFTKKVRTWQLSSFPLCVIVRAFLWSTETTPPSVIGERWPFSWAIVRNGQLNYSLSCRSRDEQNRLPDMLQDRLSDMYAFFQPHSDINISS